MRRVLVNAITTSPSCAGTIRRTERRRARVTGLEIKRIFTLAA